MAITLNESVEFLKIAPGLLLFPFGIYFGFKKLGYSIGCQVSVRFSRLLGPHISSIVFQNHKDRPVAILRIFGIQDNVIFEIEKPKVPILLKSLETVVVVPETYTKFIVNGQRFDISISKIRSLQIFVETPQKTVLCKHIFRPESEREKFGKRYAAADKVTNTFNDVVYGDRSLFAIVHSTGKEVQTTTVDEDGFIDKSGLFRGLHISPGNLTPEGVKAYLKNETGLDVAVFKLRHE